MMTDETRPPMSRDEANQRVADLSKEIGKLVIAHCDSLGPREANCIAVDAAARAWAFVFAWYLRQETGKMPHIELILRTWMESPRAMILSINEALQDVAEAEARAKKPPQEGCPNEAHR